MRNSSSDMAIYYTAKPSITLPFLAHSFVVACGVHSQYYPYSSLYSSAAPCSALKRSAIKSLVASRLQQTLISVFATCSQVVGKVVISLGLSLGFIQSFHSKLAQSRFIILIVNNLSKSFKQLSATCAHAKTLQLPMLNKYFYTLPTGPTNTNILIKGIGL